jgi:hypothetical protein
MAILLRISLCSLLLTIALAAVDFSGEWQGGVINTLPSGETRQTQEIYLHLSQQGNKVSGTIGPSKDKQVPIDQGEVDGDRLKMFQGKHRVLELTLTGERLVGTMRHANHPKDPAARLELERIKP